MICRKGANSFFRNNFSSMKHPVESGLGMGVFFQKRGALGKAHAERGSKAGGEPPQSIRHKPFCWNHREVLRPPYIIAPATHRPPSFSLLKKDPHAQTLRHFQIAKVLHIFYISNSYFSLRRGPAGLVFLYQPNRPVM
jgi:hypothetical protein